MEEVYAIVISIITFLVGLIAGRRWSDRPAMKDLYRKLYSRFNYIEKKLRCFECILLTDVENDTYNSVASMNDRGELLELKKFKRFVAVQLESELETLSQMQIRLIPKINRQIINILTKSYNDNFLLPEKELKYYKKIVGCRTLYCDYSILLSDKEFRRFKRELMLRGCTSIYLYIKSVNLVVDPVVIYSLEEDFIGLIRLLKHLRATIRLDSEINEFLTFRAKKEKMLRFILKELMANTRNPYRWLWKLF